jgi:hypothetical protein
MGDFGRIVTGVATGGLSEVGKATGLLGGQDAVREASAQQAKGQRNAIGELRRQFNITQEQFAPFLEAGAGALPGVQQASTIGGFGDRLKEIFESGVLDPLIQERTEAVEAGLSSGGLRRSGAGIQELANVPPELAFQLEQLLAGRESNLAGSGQNAAAQLGAFGQDTSQQVAGQLAGIGKTHASGILGAQQAKAAQSQQLINTGVSVASLFSDPALKDNVEEIGEAGGLSIYQWDWKPETKGTIVEKCGTIGFMADEVELVFPEYVHSYGGFKVIDYPALLDTLDKEAN